MKYISILIFFVALAGCSQKDAAITSLKNGSMVAWFADGEIDSFNNDDCGKAFQSINGLITVFQYKDGSQIATQLWGGATTQDKKDNFLLMVDPVTGLSTVSKISSSVIENGKLVQTVIGEKNGDTQKFKFSGVLGDKNSVVYEGWEFVNPNEKQSQYWETLKERGVFKPKKNLLCTSTSFQQYISPKQDNSGAKTAEIDNAMLYVMNKKWSLDDMNCRLNGGAYQVFSNAYPGGYAFFSAGKPVVSDAPQEYQYREIGKTQFVLQQRIGANNFVANQLGNPNALAAEMTMEVTLVSPTRIEYRKFFKKLNWDAMMKGQVQYENEEANGYGLLCE